MASRLLNPWFFKYGHLLSLAGLLVAVTGLGAWWLARQRARLALPVPRDPAEPFNLSRLLQQFAAQRRRQAALLGIQLECRVKDGLWVQGVPAALQSQLERLWQQAQRHPGRYPLLQLDLVADERWAWLCWEGKAMPGPWQPLLAFPRLHQRLGGTLAPLLAAGWQVSIKAKEGRRAWRLRLPLLGREETSL
ncbi:hypothetical protein ABHF91_17160 [Pseudaeromonas sp. ZJS20]|uniref:hypothetical protein n=1 Tax=Pseudaeromonas aegiceratis TaxID=3153928 RepID=UPI00390C8013